MKVSMSGRDLIIEGATNQDILGGSFRNFAGIERKDPHTGRIVNSKGKRSFNLRIPDEYVDVFKQNGANIKEFGGNPDEGEPPIRFTKVNVNTDSSNRPPKIQIIKNNNKLEELPVTMYGQLDGMFVENCDMVMNFYHKYDPASIYLNLMIVKPHMDPISAKYSALMDDEGIDPNAPDVCHDDDAEMPF